MTVPYADLRHVVSSPLAETDRRRRHLVRQGRWREADELAERALRDAVCPRDDEPGLACLTYVPAARICRAEGGGNTAALSGGIRALLLANRGLNRAEAVHRARLVLNSSGRDDLGGFWAAVLALIHADDLPSAARACARAATTAAWSRSALHRDALTLLRGRTWAASGRLPKALAAFGRARGTGTPLAGVAAAWYAEALSAAGQHRQAYSVLHESGFDGAGRRHPERAQLLAARSAVHLATGNFQLGLRDALACGESVGAWGVRNPAVLPWRSQAALCASALGRSDFAIVLARQEHELALRWGTARARGTALYAVGVVQRDVEALLDAENLLSGVPAALDTVRLRYALGCLLLSLARRDEAEQRLTAAAGAGIPPWSTRAAATLRRMTAGRWTPALTEQERKVARLALAGRTNREVALDLHLAARTVEFHLSNTYRKLGISGRDELATAALLIG
ncbi:LuxR C-terminal-related transcriptional regulator [Streptomyces acidiscabies]|uniref:LuxR C-terminal-related transcriptional regulator n=1 Tax=Streptomyces acidiscabies TaxID=42234 RepID=UPI0038F794FE